MRTAGRRALPGHRKSYPTGALKHLRQAKITFRCHTEAQLIVDEVRCSERAEHGPLLRNTRYLWLPNPPNLTGCSARAPQGAATPALARPAPYRWMLRFDGLDEIEDPDHTVAYLGRWRHGAVRSGLGPTPISPASSARVLAGHRHWWHSRITNGLLEASTPRPRRQNVAPGLLARLYCNSFAMIHLIARKLGSCFTHAK